MITQFRLVDRVGKVLGEGEMENVEARHHDDSDRVTSTVYRLFSPDLPDGYAEFETLEAMFAQCGGVAIQPQMFPTPARTRQLGLLDDVEYRAATDARMPPRE